MITIRYKKPEWNEWIFWPCDDEKEAKMVKQSLLEQGYQVEGY